MNIRYIIIIPISFIIIFSIILTNFFISFEHNILDNRSVAIEKRIVQEHKQSIKNNVDNLINILNYNLKYLLKMKKDLIKEKTINAIELVDSIYKENPNLSKKQLFDKIKHNLSYINKLDKSKYYYIYSLDGTCVSVPIKKSLEGQNLINLQDIKGNYVVQDTIKSACNGDGYNTWYFTNPNTNEIEEKVGYAAIYKPLNIFIGTAIYKRDIKEYLKEYAIKLFRDNKVSKDGYIFAYDLKGNTISHGKKELIGTNRWNLKINNSYPIQHLIKLGQKTNGSFWEYKASYNPLSKINTNKISYIKEFKELGWVIGTGFYTQELNQEIKKSQSLYHDSFKKELSQYILMITSITALLIIVLWYILDRVAKQIQKTNNKLKNSLQNFQYLIDTVMETIIISDIDRNIININESGLKMFNMNSKDEILGTNLLELIPDYELKKLENNLLKPTTIPYELDIKIENKIFHTISGGKNIIRDGKEVRVSTIIDLTEIKQKDKLIQQQAKLATMGEMIGNIAHQWRQPLNGVGATMMKLELLNDTQFDNNEEVEKIVDDTNQALSYMSKTIDDFRNFFAVDKESEYFNAHDTIIKAISLVQSHLDTLNINISIDEQNNKIKLYGHKNELIQVILNLINNAKDALSANTNQALIKQILIVVKYDKSNVTIQVKDNAGGIPLNIINKIFEPYFTTKFKSKGTGIGLYMSKLIIEKDMNGVLSVENDKDGAVFNIVFKTLPS